MQKSKVVTIVIPVWKDLLSKEEEISLRQCFSVLTDYTFTFVTFSSLDISRYIDISRDYNVNTNVKCFSLGYFESVAGYNRLLKSVKFYLSFREFKYILIHQLDAFVFKDELSVWTKAGYSYIGAPWLEGYTKAAPDAPIIGVGNGGFSLRNVNDHLRVLFSFKFLNSPHHLFKEIKANNQRLSVQFFTQLLIEIIFRNNTHFLFNNKAINEDIYWGDHASQFTWFVIPEWQTALKFSIEMQPKRFLKNNSDLPFGCHAWWKYDVDFWRPYIQNYGYEI